MKYCPYCGKAMPAHDFKFCPECGARLPQDDMDRRTTEELWQETPERDERGLTEEPYAPMEPGEPGEPEWEERGRMPEASPVAVAPYDPGEAVEDEQEEEDGPEVFLRPDGWTPDEEEYRAEPPHAAAKKKHSMARIWPAFLVAVLLLGGVAGFTVLKLRQSGAAEREAARFARDLYAGSVNVGDLETSGSGLTPGAANEIADMSRLIKQSASEQEFKAHLLAMGDSATPGYNEALSSFEFRQTKDTLFSQRFKVRITAVPVLVKTSIEDATIYVDGQKADAASTEGGLTLSLAPMRHELRAVYEGYGTDYELGSAEIASLSKDTVQEVALSQKTASVSIELSGVETNLKLEVDGRGIAPEQTGGWITLDPAFVGMDIEVSCAEYAQSFEITAPGKQVLTVDYIGMMEQKNPGGRDPDPEMLTNRQLADKLGKRFYTCYRSYLEASNREDEKLIRDADEDYLAALVQNTKDYNRGYLFEFKSIEVDRRSVTRSEKDGEQFATVRVEVLYNYAKRTDSPNWLAGFNRQDVTLRFDRERNDWLVYGSRVNDELELSDDTFTIT